MIATPARPPATAAVPTVACEIGLEPSPNAETGASAGVDAVASTETATQSAAGTLENDAGAPADFAAVIASTTAPVRTTALVAQPARPMAVGTHAPQGPGLGGAFFALVMVLGLILGLAWLLKRLPGGGFRQADGLRIVASIPLGAKERAAVVQVGGEQLLIGIGAGGVRTLHVLPQPLPDAPPAQMPTFKTLPDFKQLLAQRLRKDT